MTNFTKFSVHITCGRGSFFYWFVDDVMALVNYLQWFARWRPGRSLLSTNALFVIDSLLVIIPAIVLDVPAYSVSQYTIFCMSLRTDIPTNDVIRVHPLYGPVSGGTRVTITGETLPTSNITSVLFGRYKSFLIIRRYQFMSHYVAYAA